MSLRNNDTAALAPVVRKPIKITGGTTKVESKPNFNNIMLSPLTSQKSL